jgi:hypothetical protein
MWDHYQHERLRFEAGVLTENHPHLDFVVNASTANVWLWHWVAPTWYRLRLEVPGTYPDARPNMYVEQPCPLMTYGGKRMSEFAPSHNYHLLSTSAAGEVQICHFPDSVWDASKSLHLAVLKGKLWLQAYAEHHLRTGQPICDFFGDCS